MKVRVSTYLLPKRPSFPLKLRYPRVCRLAEEFFQRLGTWMMHLVRMNELVVTLQIHLHVRDFPPERGLMQRSSVGAVHGGWLTIAESQRVSDCSYIVSRNFLDCHDQTRDNLG